MKSIPSKDVINIVQMRTKGLEHAINLVNKAVAGFEKIDSQFWKFDCGWKCDQTAS